MTDTKMLTTHRAGMIRIFMTRGTRAVGKGRGRLSFLSRRRPLYLELIHAARHAASRVPMPIFPITALAKTRESKRRLEKYPIIFSLFTWILSETMTA
ncbi:hypothetical protein [Komagataeibacter kakiaceti]|uniref:hypothetical protein n=1 Tax=Komagataeibacter kakiaceti TaxID=943261 RepID=UPI001F568040|nr:hypothetical protein [Komagataeibacter kakiaceti]